MRRASCGASGPSNAPLRRSRNPSGPVRAKGVHIISCRQVGLTETSRGTSEVSTSVVWRGTPDSQGTRSRREGRSIDRMSAPRITARSTRQESRPATGTPRSTTTTATRTTTTQQGPEAPPSGSSSRTRSRVGRGRIAVVGALSLFRPRSAALDTGVENMKLDHRWHQRTACK